MKINDYDRWGDYELDHPLWEKLSDDVTSLMCQYGPDGHCDGWEIITHFLLTNYEINLKEK